MPVKYKVLTPEAWLENLKGGKYSNLTSALKSVGMLKAWDKAKKARAKELAKAYFAAPGKFKESFYPSTPTKDLAPPVLPEAPEPTPADTSLGDLGRVVRHAHESYELDRAIAHSVSLASALRDTVAAYEGLHRLSAVLEVTIDVSEVLLTVKGLGNLCLLLEKATEQAFLALPKKAAVRKSAAANVVAAASSPEEEPEAEQPEPEPEAEDDEEEPADPPPTSGPRRPPWAASS